MRTPLLVVSLLILCRIAVPVFGVNPERYEFFESKIRPVLAESCYDCHNSVNKKKAGLALDYRDALLAGSENGSVIEPGNPEDSPLIWAIRHEDTEMPAEGPKLSDAVIKDFENWIAMGAPDPRDKKPTQLDLDNAVSWETLLEKRRQWWSFQPLERVRPPRVEDTEWNQSPIDRFILAAFDEKGLTPQAKAEPGTLVRRLHLILTGLPPSAETVKRFVDDPSESAYQQIVDDLLASDAFGERWGRHWMDWYRYADSHGSEGDPDLPYASAYRDYIIRALNDDVPYDQLIREHIAGDLLRKPRLNEQFGINESAIGPAHFRMIPHGFGVTDAYQEQIVNTDNQIDVISKAMLGVTVSCARCHNHKFDPISQADFYRLYGVMISNRPGTRNIDTLEKQNLNKRDLEKIKRRIRSSMADYWMDNLDEAMENLAAFDFQVTEEEAALIADLKKRANRRKKTLPEDPTALERLYLKQELQQVGEYHPLAPLAFWAEKSDQELTEAWNQQLANYQQELLEVEAAKRDATYYADLRDQKTLDSWYGEGNGLAPKVSPAGVFAVATEGVRAIAGIYPAGVYSHLLSDKHNGTLASPYHTAEGDWSYMRAIGKNGAIRMSARNYPLEQGLHPYTLANTGFMQWFPLQKYKFWNDDRVHYQISTAADKPVKHLEGRSWFGVTEVVGGDAEIKELGTPLFTVLDNEPRIAGKASLLEAYRQGLEESIVAWKRGRSTDAQAQYLSAFVRYNLLPNRIDSLPANLTPLIAEYRALESAIPFPTRAPALLEGDVIDQPLLVRGEYKKAAEPVRRQFLEVFDSRPYSPRHSGRLELAEDIISSENTLKSRVIVNRLWHYVFGKGIVSTTDNFGRLGKEPTHPELLDYLALDFEKQDWSIKTALRQMVLSRAFRSGSGATEASEELDPNNEYLSYFHPRRLEAESIMDSVSSMAGEDFQRAVYAKTKRNQLDPFLAAFNLPIPTTTNGVRDSTNVPAQALTMLNSDFTKNAAKDWARRALEERPNASAQSLIESLYWEAYARRPSESEFAKLTSYYKSIEDTDTAVERIAFALLNSKEFIYVY